MERHHLNNQFIWEGHESIQNIRVKVTPVPALQPIMTNRVSINPIRWIGSSYRRTQHYEVDLSEGSVTVPIVKEGSLQLESPDNVASIQVYSWSFVASLVLGICYSIVKRYKN